ncbi:MAG TPA: hypothetical protein VG099_05200 [Gemmataceae bacterium]|nr:hypothetical protein [Gemmataceae bacterium]
MLIGIGFFSVFSGGILLLLAGLVLALTLFVRRRGRRQGWPALLYGAGAATAALLLPYILQPPPCSAGSGSGCYQAFTVGTFAVAVIVALGGLALAFVELRRGGTN